MPDILDRRVLGFSDTDYADWRALVEGTVIIGGPGSGKTTTVGSNLAMGILKTPNSGGLILCAKSTETDNWLHYADLCGRSKDVIRFCESSSHVFDPLHYEFSLREGRGKGDVESTIDLISTLATIGKKEMGQGHDPFWQLGLENLIRNVVKQLQLAGEPISIATIDRAINSLPASSAQLEDAKWQRDSYAAQIVESMKDRKADLTPDQLSDLLFAVTYLYHRWPDFDDRPRSSLGMMWSGLGSRFVFNPFNRLFCSQKCSFTPEQTFREGKIVICDFPMLEYGHETGRLINIILKLIFQRAWLRRNVAEFPNPVFLWQDELQYFVVPKFDNFFQQTCRGSRVAVVGLTQNILNISEELGEGRPGSKTKSFLGNLGLKIFLQQNEIETCTYAADQIGKEYRYLDSFNASGGEQANASFGGNQHLAHILEPIEFTRLLKPDSNNVYAQGIVYQSGKHFNATKTAQNPQGHNYLSVYFSREEPRSTVC